MCKFRVFAVLALAAAAAAQQSRPPAVPLIACDPYFSVWSTADRLNQDETRHWTGTPQPINSMARIDGKTFRLIGRDPRDIAALPQTSVEVLPTRTLYRFAGEGIALDLTFLTPLLPRDLDLMSRPITYLIWSVRSTDGRSHKAQVYFDASGMLAVNTGEQAVTAARRRAGEIEILQMGSQHQPVLEKKGDNLRIDWGYLYLAGEGSGAIAGSRRAAAMFVENGSLPDTDDVWQPAAALDRSRPALVWRIDLGDVGAAPVEKHVLLAYDDLFSIEYFYRRLRPYWRRNGAEAVDLIRESLRDYPQVRQRCERFDRDLMADLRKTGGEAYAQLSALAFRQAFAAHKLVADLDGTPLFFPKENFSNGCIGTVDVIYPASPILLLFQPELLKASLTPVLQYAEMPRWRFPFAPHDLGTYPLANGQVYGGGERTEENQMPVEESANMLLMVAGLARAEGNANYAAKHWGVLAKWAAYLQEKGLDPENQLCTDDFAGHLAHNANLSLKAILALDAYAMLAQHTGHASEAKQYHDVASKFARDWMRMASDGDHYRLTFDKPGTWSQKYNLVWDQLLGLKLFPPEVARKEIAYYKTRQNRYGLPLDGRKDYTKLDWLVWSATLAESRADFEALVAPAWKFANESPSRVPLTDWYDTVTGKQSGFQARSVVGGVFVKMLADRTMAAKWSGR